VPAVAGDPATLAVDALESAGLVVRRSEAHHDVVPQGSVVATNPGPRERVRRDGTVEVVVSLGVLTIEVPELAGATEAEAVAALDAAGLSVGAVTRPYDMTVPKGTVISSDPERGTVVPHDRPVDLAVSNGREPVTIPSVVGAPQATAERELAEAGLVPKITTDHSDDVPAGTVMAQDPPSGPALRGDTVSVTVSLGPPLVEVPVVVGTQVGEATRRLEDAGFEVRVQRVLGGFFGTVRACDPAAGTRIPRGSTVTLTIV
jgi:serine/threonine-protein kinase